MSRAIVRPMVLVVSMGLPVLVAAGEAARDPAPDEIPTERLVTEATAFLDAEIAVHVAAVGTLDPPPPAVLGVPTKGDFTWGSFMRALAETSALTGRREIAGRDVPTLLGRLGLIESRLGGKTFSQLGAALSLRQYGTDLRTNPVWSSLSPAEQAEWRALLDPGRFYSREKRQVIDLPENYFGVAARIVTMDHQMGLEPDRAFAEDVLERAAGQFVKGALYTDDAIPTGRYDRYSQEYARFVHEAAGNVGRADIQAAMVPPLTAVMRTWWDLVAPDGYGYPWGRTIGAISYMDTLDIIGFLAEHPELRPAPLRDLAAAYWSAWQWLQHDYRRDRHLIDMFGFGRGSYSYMTPERQWQQTTSFMAKAAGSLRLLRAALEREKVAAFPARPALPEVARFEWFRRGDRPAGVWLVRQGALRFALPFTTGPRAGIADYLPAPHGIPGFAAPVEQLVPALVPHLEMEDGRVLVASDGADEIVPAPDGRGLRAVWRRWATVGGRPGEPVETGLVSEVTFSILGDALVRREMISAAKPLRVRRVHVLLPCTGNSVAARQEAGRRIDRFEGPDGALEVAMGESTVPWAATIEATGDTALGKGARGPIPLVLHWKAEELEVGPQTPLRWTLRLRVPSVINARPGASAR